MWLLRIGLTRSSAPEHETTMIVLAQVNKVPQRPEIDARTRLPSTCHERVIFARVIIEEELFDPALGEGRRDGQLV